jgi:Type I phosphodiesterase / nucleotide pyrophosphatase
MEKPPSHDGSGLVNLMAELEWRLGGQAPFPRLAETGAVPDAATYVLVLFDGLGMAQLEHDAATGLRSALAGSLHAPFPTTTSVSLATVATGLTPSQHGQVAHLTWYPDLGEVVNTLKWVTPSGDPVAYEYGGLLPRPNLWERLRAAGIEPITVQPGEFAGSPLSRAMYRGARFEGAWDAGDLVEATTSLATEPGRLIFTYVPFVDYAGHVFGQGSVEFDEAMRVAVSLWDGMVSGLPPGAAVVGTADHGLMEVAETDKILVRDRVFDSLRFAGDSRGVHVWGEERLVDDLATATGSEVIEPGPLFGPAPSDKTLSHLPPHLLLAPPGKVIIPRGFDKRLRCYHGGLMPEEVDIPLLIG